MTARGAVISRDCLICGAVIPVRSLSPSAYAKRRTCGDRCGRVLQTTNNRRNRGPYYREEDRGHETPCWIWQRYQNATGYGVANKNGLTVSAHKLFYERAKGPIPQGLQIDHLCRVRTCVNPAHLEAVTQTENVRRGQAVRLSLEIARAIRASSLGATELGNRYGVSRQTIYDIRRNRAWRDDGLGFASQEAA